MAGLITSPSVGDADATGLVGFITGNTAAKLVGQVTQDRNNLSFDFGELLSGAANNGTIFNIRINGFGDYEFGENLSFRSRLPRGVVDTGDSFSIPTTLPGRHMENMDVARLAQTVLLLSKDLISEEDVNTKPAFTNKLALDRVDAFDRMNIEADGRPFKVNDVLMEWSNNRLSVLSRPGFGAGTREPRNPELEAIKRKISQKQETLQGNGEVETVPAEGLSIGELAEIREEMEKNHTYVAYNFTENTFVGSDNFAEVIPALASVPDAYFFGANMAFQLQAKLGDDIPEGAKNEIFTTTLNYFGALVQGVLTGLPTQIRSEYEQHTSDILTGLYDGDVAKVDGIMDTIMPVFEEMVQNVMDAVAEVPVGADIDELREGLGIHSNGGTYRVAKYTSAF